MAHEPERRCVFVDGRREELRQALLRLAASPDRNATLSVTLYGVRFEAAATFGDPLQGVPPTEGSSPASRMAVEGALNQLAEAGLKFELSMPVSSQLVLSLPSDDGAPSMTMGALIETLRNTQGVATIHPDGRIDIIIG